MYYTGKLAAMENEGWVIAGANPAKNRIVAELWCLESYRAQRRLARACKPCRYMHLLHYVYMMHIDTAHAIKAYTYMHRFHMS
jgi:hypothetical protein